LVQVVLALHQVHRVETLVTILYLQLSLLTVVVVVDRRAQVLAKMVVLVVVEQELTPQAELVQLIKVTQVE
jgi:hypothetical protein